MTTTRALALQPVTARDRPYLLRLYGESRAAELATTGWSEDQRRAFVELQFTAQDTHYRGRFPNASFDLVLLDGVPAGRLYVDRRPATIHVLDILVAAERRGTGIGTALLRALMDEAAAGGRAVSLYVEALNPARAWYERLGFLPDQRHEVHVLMTWSAS
jgi:ribosomal protein S18 acetylase RimI-like enzyme